jgi:Tol biopolymer transport system component
MVINRRRSLVVCMAYLAVAVGCGGGGGGGGGRGGKGEPTQTTRVSVSTAGVQANGASDFTTISGDGRIVVFVSRATNLTPDAGGCDQQSCLFIRDLAAGTTSGIAVPAVAVLGPSLPFDGRLVAFTAQLTQGGASAVLVVDRESGATERVDVTPDGLPSQAPGTFLTFPAISADGRFVAFGSDAIDLVAGDTNEVADVFVRDRLGGVTERVSVSSDGTEANASSGFFIGPALSADGRFVTFKSAASNLVPDDHNGAERCLELEGCGDVFVRDRGTGITERVSVTSDGTEANGSSAINISLGISADGRFVVFNSNATNLVAGDVDHGIDWFDAYRHDRQTGATEPVNVAANGARGNAPSFVSGISADGRFVIFAGGATNLLPGPELECDGTFCGWVFIREPATGTTTIANVASDGSISTHSATFGGALSGDGDVVTFTDFANDLVPSDTNNESDAFVRGPLQP